jgi:hypothetical protein
VRNPRSNDLLSPPSRQEHYITCGNLAENHRVMLFVIDYERGRRLKIWGRAKILDQLPAAHSQALAQSLSG